MGATERVADDDGEPIAASGVRMSTRNLACIGMMMLDGGPVNGHSVVPVKMSPTK